MKKIMAAILAVVLVCSLTGCMSVQMEEKISKNGGIADTAVMYLDRASLVDYLNRKAGSEYVAEAEKELLKEYSIQNIDGKEYYVSKPETEKTTIAKNAKLDQTYAVKGSYQLWETGICVDLKKTMMPYDDFFSFGDEFGLTEQEEKNILDNSYLEYSVVFDYDIVKVDGNGTIDNQNPKKATWKFSLNNLNKAGTMEAYCKSDISVTGVKQGATYKKAPKVKFSGASSATYKGKKVKSGTKFKKHGQHTLILKAASGEQRTVTFFVDKKKPTIRGVKNKKTYKKAQYFTVYDKDSGVASVKINGKKRKVGEAYYELNKKGTYKIVVKDKVGNTTKVKVKIKKKKK